MKKIYFILFMCLLFTSKKISAQCSTPTVVPYYEDFQGITVNGQFPACWAISSSVSCSTFTSSSIKMATFNSTPAGSNYVYSNAISFQAGVVYSVSIWYITQINFGNTWTELSILLCPNQLPAGSSTITSAVTPVFASFPTALSNTFVVSSSGDYYIALKSVSNGSSSVPNLSWDDLAITIPCTSALNPVNVSIAYNSTVFCSNSIQSYTASGASTYSWSNGETSSIANYTSTNSSYISVTGTNTLTGCSGTNSLLVSVNPSPNILINASASSICLGKSSNLAALGASSFTWDSGQNGNSIVVSPTISTTYTVTGSNANGCESSAVQYIQVNPLPTVSIISSITSNTICNGDQDTLIAAGASNYTWTIGQILAGGNQIVVSPTVTTNYVVVGQDGNGCESQASLVLTVNGCTGINQIPQANEAIIVAPNPFQEELQITTENFDLKKVEIIDLSGRVILQLETHEQKLIINTRYYSKGLYFVKIDSEKISTFFKLIKD